MLPVVSGFISNVRRCRLIRAMREDLLLPSPGDSGGMISFCFVFGAILSGSVAVFRSNTGSGTAPAHVLLIPDIVAEIRDHPEPSNRSAYIPGGILPV
jgi:hypothetical protein